MESFVGTFGPLTSVEGCLQVLASGIEGRRELSELMALRDGVAQLQKDLTDECLLNIVAMNLPELLETAVMHAEIAIKVAKRKPVTLAEHADLLEDFTVQRIPHLNLSVTARTLKSTI